MFFSLLNENLSHPVSPTPNTVSCASCRFLEGPWLDTLRLAVRKACKLKPKSTEKRRNLALCSQLQPVHAAHPSFTNVDHSKKAAQHLVAASLQSRPTWTTGQRASLLDTRRFAKSQLLLRTAMPWAASNCKLADKMNTTVTTMSSSSAVPFKSLQSPSHFCQALLYPYHIRGLTANHGNICDCPSKATTFNLKSGSSNPTRSSISRSVLQPHPCNNETYQRPPLLRTNFKTLSS